MYSQIPPIYPPKASVHRIHQSDVCVCARCRGRVLVLSAALEYPCSGSRPKQGLTARIRWPRGTGAQRPCSSACTVCTEAT